MDTKKKINPQRGRPARGSHLVFFLSVCVSFGLFPVSGRGHRDAFSWAERKETRDGHTHDKVAGLTIRVHPRCPLQGCFCGAGVVAVARPYPLSIFLDNFLGDFLDNFLDMLPGGCVRVTKKEDPLAQQFVRTLGRAAHNRSGQEQYLSVCPCISLFRR
jgi:hypothetical protein